MQALDFVNSSLQVPTPVSPADSASGKRSDTGNEQVVRDALATGDMNSLTSDEELADNSVSGIAHFNAMLRSLNGPCGTECVRMVSSAKIYQRLIAYVYVQLKTSLPPHFAQNALDSLHRVLGTWRDWDDLQWLANHNTVRSTLWDILNQRIVNGDTQYAQYFDLEILLNSDFLAIQSQLLFILHNRERKRAFHRVCSTNPVPTLNLLQTILDQGNLSANDQPRVARTLTRLAKSSACLPDCLMLSKVKRTGRDPVAGGGFADVWFGYFDSTPVAIKALRIYEHSDQEKALKEFSHEAIIWRLLRHPNILPFYGVFGGDEHFDRLCLVSPWMYAGNVIKYLGKNPESDRFALLGDVVNGLAYLHGFQPAIIHGDLKGANIFITSGLTACLGDFGLSRFRDSQESTLGATTRNTAGTLRWQAPEIFDSHEDGRTNCPSQESDIYSFGCVCLELMTGKPPFTEIRGDGAVVKAIMNKQTPKRPAEDLLKYGFDDDLWDLMEKCWNYAPTQRPEIGLLLEYFNRRRSFSVHLNSNGKLSRETRATLDQYGFPDDHVQAITTMFRLTLGDNTPQQYIETQKDNFKPYLRQRYGPGEIFLDDPKAIPPNSEDDILFPERHRRSSPRAAKIRQLLGDDAPERYIDNANANSKPWYLRSTYGQDEILINPDGGIRGGTLAALVERLTTHEYGDPIFIKTFLMTYKSFTNLNELFDLLVARFNIQAPDGLKPDELEEWKKSKQTIVRVRVINTFKTMIADSDVLEKDDNYILERMKGFAFNPDVAQLNARKPLLSLIERAQAGGDSVVKMAAVSSQFGPQSIQPKVSSSRKLKFLDVDALEMARQLTILESRVYNKIRAVECLQRARESNKVGEHHDHIADVIQVTNKIAYWVTNTVLSKEDSRKRAAIVKHFISIADRCRTLHNFSSMFAIISGLNSPPIRRLKRTWEQVNSKFMSQLGTCEMTLDSGKKFSNYRSTLAQVNPPCIPFIGIYLVDLNIIQSGSKDYLQLNVINFDKRQKAAEIIHEIKHWQSKQFDLLPLPAVLAFIEVSLESFNGTTNWDDYFWNTSLEREPRDRKDKKMARLLQKNGFL